MFTRLKIFLGGKFLKILDSNVEFRTFVNGQIMIMAEDVTHAQKNPKIEKYELLLQIYCCKYESDRKFRIAIAENCGGEIKMLMRG